MDLAGRRVLVTGGTGYLGGALVRAFVARGAAVTALARRPEAAPHLAGRPGVTLAKGDVTDPASLDLAGHDVVVHAAAWVAFGIPKGKRDRFWATNVGGTQNVVDACRRAGVTKLVHVSSVAALGTTGPTVADESFVPGPYHRSYYETTKRAAHEAALAATDLDVAAVMPGVIVGKAAPWPDGAPATGRGPFDVLLERFAAGKLPVGVAGDKAHPYVHVDDVADATVEAALRGHGAYLLVDENLTLRGLLEGLAERTGRRAPRIGVPAVALWPAFAAAQAFYHVQGKVPPVSTELVASLAHEMRFSSARARKELAWAPDLFGKLARDYG